MLLSYFLFILFSFFFSACSAQTTEKKKTVVPEQVDSTRIKTTPKQATEENELSKLTIDSLWNYLIFTKGGCLTGGQHVHDGKFGWEACVMTRDKDWDIFFDKNKKELSDFLIEEISSDTTETEIHTCPFYSAIPGEVAVYCLQKIYGLNWYDFDEFKEYQNKETTGSKDNYQAWLQKILFNKKQRAVLIKCWKKKVEG